MHKLGNHGFDDLEIIDSDGESAWDRLSSNEPLGHPGARTFPLADAYLYKLRAGIQEPPDISPEVLKSIQDDIKRSRDVGLKLQDAYYFEGLVGKPKTEELVQKNQLPEHRSF